MKLNRFANYAWFVVAYNLFVILWGAYVRASGSGAGCGSHWPLCNGEVLPRSPQTATLIELTHRITSGLSLLLVIGLVVWAFRVFAKKHPVRRGAMLSLFFIITEALIGAGLVLFELVADNASIARAMFMSVHLINTFTLMAFLALTAWWASGGQFVRLKEQGFIIWLLGLALFGMLALAVSGAVAALGDTLFPSNSLAQGLSDDFSPTAHLLIRLRLLHPVLALTVGCITLLVAGLVNFLRPGGWVRFWMLTVTALVVVQLGAGLLNVALLAPIWLQLVHLLLADFLWLAMVLLTASALAHTAKELSVEELSLRPELTT
ncbi:MAG: COX15/CtaA family protein [Pyrinomonadaceae bacterium]|nr:COX15/CtaA family protein [Pyrinomonadaceae bacterium]